MHMYTVGEQSSVASVRKLGNYKFHSDVHYGMDYTTDSLIPRSPLPRTKYIENSLMQVQHKIL